MDKRIIIGSDGSGYELKEAVKKHLVEEGYEVEDVGTQDPENPQGYFLVAPKVAAKVSDGTYARGVLICGTGMGMSIVANKFPRVYAAICRTIGEAHYSRAINNANIITMGGWITGPVAGCGYVDEFLNTEFLEGLEDWRQKNLTKAFATVQDMEKENFK